MVRIGRRSPCSRAHAQALVEFAFVLPVTLLLMLGIFEFGRAFVFGVALQNGAREAARIAATADYHRGVTDSTVVQRLVDASNPAISDTCNVDATQSQWKCGTWTVKIWLVRGGVSYDSIEQARRTSPNLAGSQVSVSARGDVALLPGLNTGMAGMTLPSISVQGQSTMVVL